MTTSGQGRIWTGEQLSAHLAALGGVAPEVTQYAVYWALAAVGSSGDRPGAYSVPGDATRLAPASFDFWLAQRGIAGTARLAVAVLVVRAELTPDGGIGTCALEYRRGAADGPYHGNPARITFTGPARDIRFYRAAPDGQLQEIAPTPNPEERPCPPTEDGGGIVSAALAAWFETQVPVAGARAPTVIEAMLGIARVFYLARPDWPDAACGVLWHGPLAVALPAAFPRFDIGPELTPEHQTALAPVLAAEQLVVCETRRDDQGVCVVARRQGTQELAIIRLEGTAPLVTPYVPGLPSRIAEAQAQWVRYIETYEHMRVRDAYRDGQTGGLIVLTEGADGHCWRHSVDEDGVETWRTKKIEPVTLPTEPAGAFPAPLRSAPVIASDRSDPCPFDDLVNRRFPGTAYDIDEAAQCLAQGRSTAAVFHAMRIVTHGLASYAAWRGEPNPPLRRGEYRWRVLLRWLRDDRDATELYAALDAVRVAWRGATLQVGAKYTEAEARHILVQVERFIRRLAAFCDEDGVPADELDDDAL